MKTEKDHGPASGGGENDAWDKLNRHVAEYVAEYEFRGDGDYTPNEVEKSLIYDSISGLIEDEEFRELWLAAQWPQFCAPPPAEPGETPRRVTPVEAIRSATKVLFNHFAMRIHDSEAVSDCVHCNAVFLAKESLLLLESNAALAAEVERLRAWVLKYCLVKRLSSGANDWDYMPVTEEILANALQAQPQAGKEAR